MAEREILSYERFGAAARELAQAIHDDGFRPDAIVAIARGGLTLAGALGYALDVKMLGSLNVEFYTGVEERLDEPVVLPPGTVQHADYVWRTTDRWIMFPWSAEGPVR
jgi:hypoxanthine phosphoribosyltransferase